MKKNNIFLKGLGIIVLVFLSSTVFAQADFSSIDDGLGTYSEADPVSTVQTFIKGLLTLLGLFSVLLFMVGSYVGSAYGTELLRRKYAGKINEVWSWIPGTFVFPLAKVAGISGWWGIMVYIPYIGLIPWIYMCIKLVKKLKKGALSMVGLIFLPQFIIFYLGLKENSKSTLSAWILGFLPIVMIVVIFFAWTITNLVVNVLSAGAIGA